MAKEYQRTNKNNTKLKIGLIISSSILVTAGSGLGVGIFLSELTHKVENSNISINSDKSLFIAGPRAIVINDPDEEYVQYFGNFNETDSEVTIAGIENIKGLSFDSKTKVLDLSHVDRTDPASAYDGTNSRTIDINIHRFSDNSYITQTIYFHFYSDFANLKANEVLVVSPNEPIKKCSWNLETGEWNESNLPPLYVYSLIFNSALPDNFDSSKTYYLPTIVGSKAVDSISLPHNSSVKWKIKNNWFAGSSSLEFICPSVAQKNGVYDNSRYCNIVEIEECPPSLATFTSVENTTDPRYYYGVLSKTKSLKTLESKIFSQLKYIPNNFLSETGVYDFEFNNLSNIEWIGTNFFASSFNIKNATFSSWTKLRTIAANFFYKSSIRTVIFKNVSLYAIADNFFAQCPSLYSITLPIFQPIPYENIECSVGDNFLADCPFLQEISSSSSSSSYFYSINYFGDNMVANSKKMNVISPSFQSFNGNTHNFINSHCTDNGLYISKVAKVSEVSSKYSIDPIIVDASNLSTYSNLSSLFKDFLIVEQPYNDCLALQVPNTEGKVSAFLSNITEDGKVKLKISFYVSPECTLFSKKLVNETLEFNLSSFRGNIKTHLNINFVPSSFTSINDDNFSFIPTIVGTGYKKISFPSSLLENFSSSSSSSNLGDTIDKVTFSLSTTSEENDTANIEFSFKSVTTSTEFRYTFSISETEYKISFFFPFFEPFRPKELPFNFFVNTSAFEINLHYVNNWNSFQKTNDTSKNHKPFWNANRLSVLKIDTPINSLLISNEEPKATAVGVQTDTVNDNIAFYNACNVEGGYCVLSDFNKGNGTNDNLKIIVSLEDLKNFTKLFTALSKWETIISYDY